MKRVLTCGTFDLLHPGHINILRRAKELGDELYVGVATDEYNRRKGKTAILNYDQRKQVVEAIRYVDFVFPEESLAQASEYVRKYDIDIFVIGDDWTGRFDFLQDYCTVIYLPRTEGISTTEIKNKILW